MALYRAESSTPDTQVLMKSRAGPPSPANLPPPPGQTQTYARTLFLVLTFACTPARRHPVWGTERPPPTGGALWPREVWYPSVTHSNHHVPTVNSFKRKLRLPKAGPGGSFGDLGARDRG